MTDGLDEILPPLGHNKPPTPIDPVEILAALTESNAALAERGDKLADMDARLPSTCDDDDTDHKLSDAIKSCNTFLKNAEAARVSAKEPYLTAERAVDGFYAKLSAPIDKLKKKMGAMQTAYKVRKADEERRRREAIAAEERRVAREAERLAREAEAAARKARDDAAAQAAANEARDRAERAQAEAERARKESQVKAAELSRTRTDLGSVSSLATTFDFEVVEPEAVPREYCKVHDPSIRTAIRKATDKNGNCKLKIPGVRIFPVYDSVTR